MENTKQLSAWSLCLPACRISESVQQLMELTLNTLCEAVGSSTQWYVRVLKERTVYCTDLQKKFNLIWKQSAMEKPRLP